MMTPLPRLCCRPPDRERHVPAGCRAWRPRSGLRTVPGGRWPNLARPAPDQDRSPERSAHARSGRGLRQRGARFERAGAFWRAPVLALAAGTPAVFWLWARVVFNDDFVPKVRHAAPWALLAAGVLASAYGGAPWSGPAGEILLQLASLALAVLAASQTMATWRGDLVTGRRRLRAAVLLGSVLYISIDAIYSSGLGSLAVTPAAIATIRAAGL